MPALLALLPVALEGIKGAVAIFNTIREQARKTGELTPEQDAEFQANIDAMFSEAHWKPRN